jgi:Flp pilus assembly protein TadG
MRRVAGSQSGQVTILIVGLALVCMAIAGIAVDGTRAFLYRRTLQSAADASALAGAAEINLSRYYSTGGRAVTLQLARARHAAARWLSARGLPARVRIDAEAGAVRVTLRGEVATTFLNLIGVGQLPVAVESVAEPIAGAP